MPHTDAYKLEEFNLLELNILLEHLRLGQDHLKLELTEDQLKDLLKWSLLSAEQKGWLYSDKAERVGNMALVINTVVTSTFGAWMGLSGCMGFRLGSPAVVIGVSSVASLLSSIIGYNSYHLTQKQAHYATATQKLHNLQLKILEMINQKLDQKIETVNHYLNTTLFLLENNKETPNAEETTPNQFSTEVEAFYWFDNLKRVLKERIAQLNHNEIYEIYIFEFIKIISRLRQVLSKNMHSVENFCSSQEKEEEEADENDDTPTFSSFPVQDRTKLPFIKVLTDPIFSVPKAKLYQARWWEGNILPLALGLAPALLGGFASMFVFVGGIPNVARELDFIALADLLISPTARFVELSMALFVTLYFGFAVIYSSRKILLRKQVLERTQKEIIHQETLMIEKQNKLTLLFKIKNQLQKIVSIFTILKKLDRSLSKKNVPMA